MEEKWQHELTTNGRDMMINVIPAAVRSCPDSIETQHSLYTIKLLEMK